MKTTPIDNTFHIRSDATHRKFAVFEPERGSQGTLVILKNGEVCEVDIAQLIALLPKGESAADEPE